MLRHVVPAVVLLLASGCAHVPGQHDRGPRHVEIAGSAGSFQMLVDGQPYYVRGVGFNIDTLRFAERELRAAQETGFNCLRFWGRGQRKVAHRPIETRMRFHAGTSHGGVPWPWNCCGTS